MQPKEDGLVFLRKHHGLSNIILKELTLRLDREGQRRTFYGLRHTTSAFASWKAPTFIRSPRTAGPACR